MFTAEQYRSAAADYDRLACGTGRGNERREYRNLERSFATLADDAQWVEDNEGRLLRSTFSDAAAGDRAVARWDDEAAATQG